MKNTFKLIGIIALVTIIGFSMAACGDGGDDDDDGTNFNPADGTANIGRTGPGGGRIFYYRQAGFTLYQTATDTVGVTAHYLEAAPAEKITFNAAWTSSGYTNIPGTGTAIGTGMKNTALILNIDKNAPAAKVCKDLTLGGKTDWFLPSTDELNELYKQKSIVGIPWRYYWSSSQHSDGFAWDLNFQFGEWYNHDKIVPNSVCAIRAF